ncbi:MAG TPA: peptidoglycan-binding domain-containing protein [Terrimicrobiaceae bacterium]|nr:peptidoglycan-binding domain-containing protein [Terrimicrobiaceae bacterium]
MATYKFSAMGPGFQCRDEVFEMGPIKISAPVGAGKKAKNIPDDVKAIQRALNRFTPLQGGPKELLKVDGWCGEKTLAAIHEFQKKRLG